ncbi:MAG: dihydroorotate dehydrogenase (quinone), partial [Pseudomonadota bacterium]|nr:dihydroorotate dehydrogenase (quinone) [Pseudomonadota bacterium]
NNVGSVKALENIERNKKNFSGILGVSIGKGKEISNERAHEDYLHLLDYFKDVADYYAINISSPNTNDLRKLSSGDYFNKLIDEITNKREQISKGFSKYKPIVVKISPDESLNNLEKIISYSLKSGVDGFILTNTSLDHDYNLPGGISGKPLRQKSEESLKFVRSIVNDKAVIISSGGLMTKEDAIKRFSLKADLIQLYSGFVFKGNSLLQDCLDVSST